MRMLLTVDLDAKIIFVTNSHFYDSVTIQQSYFFARLIPSAPNAWNVRKFKSDVHLDKRITFSSGNACLLLFNTNARFTGRLVRL